MSDETVYRLSDGDISLWVDNETTVHIKSITKFGDPVELTDEEVNDLIEILSKLLKRIK